MEEKTGVTFHQAQVALARKWIGKVDENWVQDTGKLLNSINLKLCSDFVISRHQGTN
jgi:hypothetical protein